MSRYQNPKFNKTLYWKRRNNMAKVNGPVIDPLTGEKIVAIHRPLRGQSRPLVTYHPKGEEVILRQTEDATVYFPNAMGEQFIQVGRKFVFGNRADLRKSKRKSHAGSRSDFSHVVNDYGFQR